MYITVLITILALRNCYFGGVWCTGGQLTLAVSTSGCTLYMISLLNLACNKHFSREGWRHGEKDFGALYTARFLCWFSKDCSSQDGCLFISRGNVGAQLRSELRYTFTAASAWCTVSSVEEKWRQEYKLKFWEEECWLRDPLSRAQKSWRSEFNEVK
jgi:hypothetical protein